MVDIYRDAKRRGISTALHRPSEYPRIFRVTGANPNARKLPSTDLVNTKKRYPMSTQRPQTTAHPVTEGWRIPGNLRRLA